MVKISFEKQAEMPEFPGFSVFSGFEPAPGARYNKAIRKIK
jgi:hypothetical protein